MTFEKEDFASPTATVVMPAPENEGPGPHIVDPEVIEANIYRNAQDQDPADAQRAAPAIVNVNNQLTNANENTNTIIDPGKPEPGRDIFANVGDEVRSGTTFAVPPLPLVHKAGVAEANEGEEVMKEISPVNVNVPVVTQDVEVERGLVDKDEIEGKEEGGNQITVAMDLSGAGFNSPKENKLHNDAEASKEESKIWTEQQSEEVGAAAVTGLEIPMGPHDEAGEVREKVAEELFGNDVDE